VLLATMHHIVCDGWSILSVLPRELGALYTAFSRGEPSPLAELAVQYADYTLWQRSWLQGDVLDQQIAYWKDQLDGAPPAIELPTDRPRPVSQSFRGAVIRFSLSPDASAEIRRLSREAGVTPYMMLLSVYALVLSRHSGQQDVVIGSPIAGRRHREVENLAGLFLNMLVLRIDLHDDPTFRDLLHRTRETALGAFAHQDLPFEKLVDLLQPARDLSRQPLFQVAFALQNVPEETVQLAGLTRTRLGDDDQTIASKFDLSLYMYETEEGLVGHFEYATDLFDGATIERVLSHFRCTLARVLASPDAPISSCAAIDDAERAQQLDTWNNTALGIDDELEVQDAVARQAAERPDAVAVGCAGTTLTYAELDARATRLARHLIGLGLVPDTTVGVFLERGTDMVAALLAILKAGAAYLPLDVSLPHDRLALMLGGTDTSLVLTRSELAGGLPHGRWRALALDSAQDDIAKHPVEPLDPPDHRRGLAYVIHTSGSTGRPKGVMVERRSLVNLLAWFRNILDFGQTDRLLSVTSLSFDIAALELFLPLTTGGYLEIADGASVADGETLRDLIAAVRPSVMQATPSTWWLLASAGWKPGEMSVICGGEALPAALLPLLSSGRGTTWNAYGPTETTIWSTAWRARPDARPSIGRPLANTQLYVLDQRLEPVPIGVMGELYIAGRGIARGYAGRPGLTAERFVASPFALGERMYRTGDLVRYDSSGELLFTGRTDDQIKLRGHRIELGEIEAALGEHPGVRKAVVAFRDAGDQGQRLIAYLVPEGAPASPDELSAHLRQMLPSYMMPSAFVTIEDFPLTPNGKIDRAALPTPDVQRGREIHLPRNEAEWKLMQIWERYLNTTVGLKDDFFASGGHSLLAVVVIGACNRALYVELPVAALFEHPTVEGLAVQYRKAAASPSSSPLITFRPPGRKRPVFCVHPASGHALCFADFASHLGEDRGVYGLQPVGVGTTSRVLPDSIEELAAAYVRIMQAEQPQGPYQLVGWSFGGLVAYEMALQLEQAGQPVPFVAVLDAGLPDAMGKVAGPATDDYLAEYVHGVVDDLAPARGLGELLREMRARGITPPDFSLAEAETMQATHRQAQMLARKYRPQRWTGRLFLVRAVDSVSQLNADFADLGWSETTGRRPIMIGVECPHAKMMVPPNAEQIAMLLAPYLAE
jgi:amino acid adenylation domain-containing protein